MDENTKERLHIIANLNIAEIGSGENNVKYKFVIPFLECFGYKDMGLEHPAGKNRIDIFIRGNLSNGIVVETKNHNVNLDNYLSQLKRYCDEKRPLIGVIVNGEEIRIYSPFWRVPNFSDTILYQIKRKELAEDAIVEKIEKILSKENLENGTARKHITERENEIDRVKDKIKNIAKEYKNRAEILSLEKKELEEKVEKTKERINEKMRGIRELEKEKNEDIKKLWDELGIEKPSNQRIYIKEKDMYDSFKIYKNRLELVLKQSFIDYKYISIYANYRGLFPDYDTEFVLVGPNIGEVTKKLRDSRSRKDPAAGNEIGIKEWYNAHPELKPGDTLLIEVIEPKKRYELIIKKTEKTSTMSSSIDKVQIKDKIKNVTREDILMAMKDPECKKTGVAEVVEYEGINYPIRHLIRLATGLKHEKGIDHTVLTTNIAKSILRKHGFTNFKRVK